MFKISTCRSQALFYVNFSNSYINFCLDREGTYYKPGGYFLVKVYWGCAAGWGRVFTTRLTIMGSHF